MLPGVQIQLPARINLLGNPADAVEGDFAVISAAVDLYAHARVTPHRDILIRHYSADPQGDGELVAEVGCPAEHLPLPITESLQLQTAALNRLVSFSTEFREKVAHRGAQIQTWTDVPRSSGLGGSSLLVLLVLAGLRAYYQLDSRRHHDYLLAELAQRIEAQDLGITCGYADRYVPLFGGLLYIDYRGKLLQQPLGEEPLATVERLDAFSASLPLVLAYSGVEHDSGDVHSRLRAAYLDEINQRSATGGAIGPMESAMRRAYETAWRGKYHLLCGDLAAFGRQMDVNHKAVDALMRLGGFELGAGAANNQLIQSAHDLGAYGAKLTGAGGGGSVFALVEPGLEQEFAQQWLEAARQDGLSGASINIPAVSQTGLQIKILGAH